MTTSIFIRSYRSDRFFLDYLLRSLEKFASGFLETVVCLPVGDEPHFEHTDFRGARVTWTKDPDCGGYLGQQVSKVEADTHCVGATILYLDSDCFITAPMRPEMFFENGNPVKLLRHWGELSKDANAWRTATKSLLGWEPEFEQMACHPMVFYRSTLILLRDQIEHAQKMPLRDYVRGKRDNAMSEFNALGAVAHRFQPYLYSWKIADPATDGYFRGIKQQWSYQEGGVQRHVEEYEAILASP